MYTAVSIVQAKNTENAKQVGDAMELHAEMGSKARHNQQQQPPPPPQSHQNLSANDTLGGGGAGYVLTGDGKASERLNGDLVMDATRQVRGRFSRGGVGMEKKKKQKYSHDHPGPVTTDVDASDESLHV